MPSTFEPKETSKLGNSDAKGKGPKGGGKGDGKSGGGDGGGEGGEGGEGEGKGADAPEYSVECIAAERMFRNKLQYSVKWLGCEGH